MSNQTQPQVGAGVFIFNEDYTKLLLHKRKGTFGEGEFSSGGGKVEYGEHPIEALKREIKEEFNIELKNIEFLNCASFKKYQKHYIDISFSAQVASGTPQIMEPDKHEGLNWYDLDNLPKNLFEPVRLSLEAYRNKQKYFETTEL